MCSSEKRGKQGMRPVKSKEPVWRGCWRFLYEAYQTFGVYWHGSTSWTEHGFPKKRARGGSAAESYDLFHARFM